MAEALEALLQQAQSSLAVGDTNKAQESLNQLLKQYPRHPQGLMRRGFVRARLNDFEGAIEDWEQSRELDPQLQRQLDGPEFGQTVEATIQGIKQRISNEPANIHLQILLGKTYAALGRYAQALQIYTSALRNDPEAIEAGYGCAQVYLRLGQGEQALAVLQKLAEQNPDNVDLCFRLAKHYMAMNSVVQATRFLERATTLDPNHWQSHLELGQIFMRQGRHEQATARFQKTLQVKADCAPALVGLAECCKELYRFEAAISYYQQAVAVDPMDYKALCQMGSLCIQLGGLDLGVETLQRALEINANDVEIHSSLAKAYQQKGDLPTAARYFAKTVEFNPKDYFAAYNLGLIYRSQGQIQQAADAFGTAAQLRPNDSQYQYQSSRALLELGKVAEAMDAAKKAVSLNPHSKESQLLYGRCCLEAGRNDEAAEAFRQAVSIDAQNVEAHYQLAVALLNLGQTEEARNSFQTVLRLSPQHAPSQLGLGHVARRTGQWQTAADHYRQAIQTDLTLRPAIQELTKLYLERNQKDSINEFIRQICLSRKGDHRVPADFLRDWVEALEANQQHALAEEALDFVLNVYPTSPQAKENHREFHLRSARQFMEKANPDKARWHIDQVRKLHPHDPALAELQQLLVSPPAPPENQFDSLDDPLWAPLDMAGARPKSGLSAPPALEEVAPPSPLSGLAPPPELDDRPSPAQSVSTLLPPPLDDFLDTDLPPQDSWQSAVISRLALEDMSAGLNPGENLANLGQHYLRLALDLEKAGWFKQAALFLTDARNFRPDDLAIAAHQLRVITRWAERLEGEGDHSAAAQLRSWLEPLRKMVPAEAVTGEAVVPATPPPVALEPEPEPQPVVAEVKVPEPSFEPEVPVMAEEIFVPPPVEVQTPFRPVGLAAPLLPPPITEPEPEPASEPEPGPAPAPVQVAAPEPVAPEPEPEPQPAAEIFEEIVVFEPIPAEVVAPEPGPEPVIAPPPVTEPEPEPSGDTQSQIVEWMMSFQDPAPAAPEPVAPPPPAPVEEDHTPYKSAEFEEVTLTGSETTDQLVSMLSRFPEDGRIRLAILRSFSDDIPGLLKVFRELSLEAPDEPYHVLNLARAYAHTGSDSLAVLQYRKYVKMEPTSEGYRELGQTYERMGKSELASQAMRRAEQLAEQEAD
ncbi:tetratricopeptide repeat protein [bacterium]|nr:tetratricopeptide repeat protein [bacterium]